MFYDNKYSRWYFSIIEKAKIRGWKRRTAPVYVEKHHIIPKCFQPNNDTVFLTAREHFVCHLLLPKMCVEEWQKRRMDFAIFRMIHGNGKNYCSSSLVYRQIKERHAMACSKRSQAWWANINPDERSAMRSGENSPRYGTKHSQESIEKMRKIKVGKYAGTKHPLYGKGHTEEAKLKCSKNAARATVGKKWFNDGATEKFFVVGTQPSNYKQGRL